MERAREEERERERERERNVGGGLGGQKIAYSGECKNGVLTLDPCTAPFLDL